MANLISGSGDTMAALPVVTTDGHADPPPTVAPPGPPPPPELDEPRFLEPGQFISDFLHKVADFALDVGRAVLPFVVAVAAIALVVGVTTWLRRRSRRGDGHFVAVAAPPAVDPAGAVAMWRTLHRLLQPRRLPFAHRTHVCFELLATPDALRVGWWVPAGVNAGAVARAVEAAWPGSRAELTDATSSFSAGQRIAVRELRLGRPEWLPLETDHKSDPYGQLLGAATALAAGEQTVIQILARPAARHRLNRAHRALVQLRSGAPMSGFAKLGAELRRTTPNPPPPPRTPDPLRQDQVRAARTKLAGTVAFEVVVRFAVVAAVDTSRRQLRARAFELAAAFGAYTDHNELRPRRLHRPAGVLADRPMGRGGLVRLDELVELAHLPTDATLAGWEQAGVRPVGPPRGIFGDGGRSNGWATERWDDDV